MASKASKAVPNKVADKVSAKLEKEVGSGLTELYLRYTCDYCQEDIPGQV